MSAIIGLSCVAALIGLAALAVATARFALASPVIYGGSLAVSLIALANALLHLVPDAGASAVALPLGLPGLGSHFRVDALAAFFLTVVNFGATTASLYALGHGRHAAFLAGMNLVVLADDAFTFLLSWEFMSLASWAIVVAHHDVPANARAGYTYLLMASFGTLCLLLCFGVLAGSEGDYAFAAIRQAN